MFLSIIKAIPGVIAIIQQALKLIEKYNERKIIKRYADKKRALDSINKQIKEAKTDENRAELLKKIHVIDGDS